MTPTHDPGGREDEEWVYFLNADGTQTEWPLSECPGLTDADREAIRAEPWPEGWDA